MRAPQLGELLDERFMEHRRRSTSVAGIICAATPGPKASSAGRQDQQPDRNRKEKSLHAVHQVGRGSSRAAHDPREDR